MLLTFSASAQNYADLQVKEEYDFYNSDQINNYQPCVTNANDDQDAYGDGMSYILEGYITMYKTTGDKGYLYKFLIQSLCMMENRHDIAGVNNDPRWSESMYHDGYIIGSMAHFVHFIELEEPGLQNLAIHPFPEITNSVFSFNFNTFGQYATWLSARVDETLFWFINNGYWDNGFAMRQDPEHHYAAAINMQIGFARAFLFNGLSTSYSPHLQKAAIIGNLFKNNVDVSDECEGVYYNSPAIRLNATNNSYWWYHAGWKVYVRKCFWKGEWFNEIDDYDEFVQFKEDISHGSIVSLLPLDYYNHQPSSSFNQTDMLRFRNTFAKNIYDDNSGFYNSMDGSDNPVYGCNGCPHNFYKFSVLNYMPFQRFDNLGTATNVYNIIMDFYATNIANTTTIPSGYCCDMNNGHAEVVKAQWEHECVNLTLYNREVVYDQDFFVKNTLSIEPEATLGNSYTEPIIATPTFTVKSGINAEFMAGESIVLKPGTHIEPGIGSSKVHLFITESACTDGRMASIGSFGSDKEEVQLTTIDDDVKLELEEEFIPLLIVPNPNEGEFYIKSSFEIAQIELLNSFGATLEQFSGSQRAFSLQKYGSGIFLLKVIYANGRQEVVWFVKK